MNLRKAKAEEYAAIQALYTSAFPKEERAPFFLIKRRVKQNRATMLVAEENGAFIGFAYTVSCKSAVYLFFLAVAEEKRGCGNGSEMLRRLKAYFDGKIIFLAREPLDASAENNRQRINRRCFYLRNGFIDLPFQVREASMIYDVMSTDAHLNPYDYETIMHQWAGKMMLRFVKIGLVMQDRKEA